MAETPALPQGIRHATLADVPRLALVATAGFYDAPQFRWERPYHHMYPYDTYLSYRNLFETCISDPDCLIYVVEDAYDISEHEKSGATIATGDLYQVPRQYDTVPAGVAMWRLPNGSLRRGLKAPESNETKSSTAERKTESAQRDINESHRVQLRSKVDIVSSKLFGPLNGLYNMIMLVVHPAYRRKGHAKALVCLGAAHADFDRASVRLIAQPNAVNLYQSVGFKILDRIPLQDEFEQFELTAMIRQPQISGFEADGQVD